jgi:beta-N-acetylhexosaminidase
MVPFSPMTTRQRAARLFVTGLSPGGVGLTPEFERLLRESPPAGVLLFRRDYRELSALLSLVQKLRALAAPSPLLVCVDEEGGFVSQVAPDLPVPPSARVLGRGATARQVESLGEYTGRVLHAYGVDVDFAPVFDVDTESTNPVIGPRAFGSDPATVSRLAVAFARGLTTGGVIPCAKHFPGHGDTRSDSHLELPKESDSRERLETRDFPPFRAAVAERIPLMMVSHVHYTAFDERPTPATLSSRLAGSLLRESFGFQGVAVTDAMEMKAVASGFGPGEAAWAALVAGCDLLLYGAWTTETEQALGAVARCIEMGESEVRVREAERRIERLFTERAEVAAQAVPAGDLRAAPVDLVALCGRAVRVEGDLAALRTASRNARWLVVEPEWTGGPTIGTLLAERGWSMERANWEKVTAAAIDRFDHVFLAHARRVAPTAEEAKLLARAAGRPAGVLAAFGQDAFLAEHPRAPLRISACDPGESMRRAVAGRLSGPAA